MTTLVKIFLFRSSFIILYQNYCLKIQNLVNSSLTGNILAHEQAQQKYTSPN